MIEKTSGSVKEQDNIKSQGMVKPRDGKVLSEGDKANGNIYILPGSTAVQEHIWNACVPTYSVQGTNEKNW